MAPRSQSFPRLHRRGLIEAIPVAPTTVTLCVVFRGFTAAASLKRLRRRNFFDRNPMVFRGFTAAASLKRLVR